MLPKKVSLQLLSEQSTGDVRITQLDWKSSTLHTRGPTAANVLSPELLSDRGTTQV